jgi:hypothetical protein
VASLVYPPGPISGPVGHEGFESGNNAVGAVSQKPWKLKSWGQTVIKAPRHQHTCWCFLAEAEKSTSTRKDRYSTSPESIRGIVFSQRNGIISSLLASLPRKMMKGNLGSEVHLRAETLSDDNFATTNSLGHRHTPGLPSDTGL